MTDEEATALNLAVAGAMGWTMWGSHDHVWSTPMGYTIHYEDNVNGLPDFCRDAMMIGYLTEWLTAQDRTHFTCGTAELGGGEAYIYWRYNTWEWVESCVFGGEDSRQRTMGEALCRAILAYVKSRKEQLK